MQDWNLQALAWEYNSTGLVRHVISHCLEPLVLNRGFIMGAFEKCFHRAVWPFRCGCCFPLHWMVSWPVRPSVGVCFHLWGRVMLLQISLRRSCISYRRGRAWAGSCASCVRDQGQLSKQVLTISKQLKECRLGQITFRVICRTGKAIRAEKYLPGLRSLCVLRSWVLLLSG